MAENNSLSVNAKDHVEGAENAQVTLIEYGDYECSYCGQAYPIVKKVQEEMGDKMQFVFRNFPLGQVHPHAQKAAEAAEIAATDDKFWEMHDLLYENQDALDEASLKDYAAQIGLDADKFAEDLDGGKYEEKVQADFMGGAENGVNGTPSFFINGTRLDGSWDYESLLAALQNA